MAELEIDREDVHDRRPYWLIKYRDALLCIHGAVVWHIRMFNLIMYFVQILLCIMIVFHI